MRSPRRRRGLLALVLVLAAGCDYFVPDVGDPLVERCSNEDSDPTTDVSFSADILAGLLRAQDTCVPCHDPGGDDNLGFEIGGLDLTSYEGLVAGGANSGQSIVIPGSPCDSLLVQKLGAGPPFGSRMPFNGPPFLDTEQIRQVADWIAEGARDN